MSKSNSKSDFYYFSVLQCVKIKQTSFVTCDKTNHALVMNPFETLICGKVQHLCHHAFFTTYSVCVIKAGDSENTT